MGFLVLMVLAGGFWVTQGVGRSSELKSQPESKQAGRDPSSARPPGPKRITFGFADRLNFKWNSMLNFYDARAVVYHPTGIKIGKYHFLREAPPALYNPYLLPESIRDDSWYLPTTVEVLRFPKVD
jgi:hypothetical protein